MAVQYVSFTAVLEGRVMMGFEATGAMQWFLELLEELGIEYRDGHPAKIRAQETREQKHNQRDAELLLTLPSEDRFRDLDAVGRTARAANLNLETS
jgi:hypothetical protein